MALNHEAYRLMKPYSGKVVEIPGIKNNDLIVEFHSMTTYRATTDEVPWCSSLMNWAIVAACIKRNPLKSFYMLKHAGIKPRAIAVIYKRFGYSLSVTLDCTMDELEAAAIKSLPMTTATIVPPTFDASAISWREFGVSVKGQQYLPGDIMIFSRPGGNHVTFFEGSGVLTYTVFGGNQDNCLYTKTYLKGRLLDVRRAST